MSQFAFRATDRMGNTVEGNVAADTQPDALSKVREMGYRPIQVQLSSPNGAASPSLTATQPLAASPLTATQPLQTAPPLAATQPISAPSRPRPIDLSSPVEEIATTATTLYGSSGGEVSGDGTAMGHLEPWERSIGLNDPANAEQTTAMTANGVQPTQAMPPGGPQPFTAPQTGRGIERPRIEYGTGIEREKSLQRRFMERVVLPVYSGVVLKDLAPFYRQFATLIGAGIPLFQALVALESSTKNPKLKELARAGQQQVQKGGRFSDVMAEYPWICSPMQMEIVRAAEQGGMLDTSLRQLADYVENDLAIRRLISRETIYPKLVLFVALMLLGRPGFFFGTMSIVRFVLGGMGKDAYTGMNYLADTIGFGLLVVLPFLAMMIAFRLFLFNSVAFREGYDTFKTSIPVLGQLIRMFATAKFCRTFAALYRGGFPMGSALQIAGNASGNFVLRKAAYRAALAADRGGMVGDSMASSGFFNALTVDMFRTGETSGSLDSMVDKIADYYEDEAKTKAHQAAIIFGTALFLLVAILIAVQVISQYGGLAQRETTIPE